jgi:secondary thiamine-phosphate synthase enzyme
MQQDKEVAFTDTLHIRTKGESDMSDLTSEVARVVSASGVSAGLVTVFVVGSTAAITTIEFEPGLLEDLPAALERIAPWNGTYKHEETWHDDNGHSHVRASLIGPSLTVPIVQGKMPLGTWQQIVLIEMDTRARNREIVVQVLTG